MTKFWVQAELPLMGRWGTAHYPFGGLSLFYQWWGIDAALVHATNTGAAYGIFSQFQGPLLVIRLALILFLVYYLYRHLDRRFFSLLPLALILAGAVGNVIDTFVYGHVVDMFQFIFWGHPFAVFNIADVAISVGVGLLLLQTCFSGGNPEQCAD